MSSFADDLATSNTPLRDDELVAYILAGLDEEYNLVFTAIVAQANPISPSELYAQLLSFKQHTALQAVASPARPSSALTTSHGHGYSGGHCYGSSDRSQGRGRGRDRSSLGGYSSKSSRTSSGNSTRPRCV
jgi:hypothetical protein